MSDPIILHAPVLRAEHWTSINLMRVNYADAFRDYAPQWEVVDLTPDEKLAKVKWGKRVLRDIVYPFHITATAKHFERSGRKPLVHVYDHSYGHLCSAWKPTVITCNDLNHFTMPTMSGPALWTWRVRARRMKEAASIMCVSAQLAGEVHEHLGIPMERLAVTYNGVDCDVFYKRPLEELARAFPDIAALAANHLLIVNIGSNIERKNLPTTLRALALLKYDRKLPVKLLKVGHSLRVNGFGPLLQELKIEDDVLDLGPMPPEKVALITNLSHALSFPSLYEGFGRPTIEAQACEVPCVLSDSCCMKEVGGDAALYHKGTDYEELAAQLELALTKQDVRSRLIKAGLENVKRFTWETHIRTLSSVYESVLADS